MNQAEAKEKAREGYKIFHQYFTSEEYIHYNEEDMEYQFEDGNKVDTEWWDKDYLQTNWDIYDETK